MTFLIYPVILLTIIQISGLHMVGMLYLCGTFRMSEHQATVAASHYSCLFVLSVALRYRFG